MFKFTLKLLFIASLFWGGILISSTPISQAVVSNVAITQINEIGKIDEINKIGKIDEKTQTEPCVVVIFGASGDLSKRKLFPALYNLAMGQNLSENTAIIGFAKSDYSHSQFRPQYVNSYKNNL